jgi:hypothetical protein
MRKFSVTTTETVVARYLPIIVEAADSETASALVEAQRCDGELDDPCHEDVQSVSYEVAPVLDTDPAPADPGFCITAAGQAVLSQQSEG